jgi:2'-5' RNA ligase
MEPAMPRYFVAVPLAEESRDRLVALQPPPTPGIRLIGPEEFHLTLHFLGELDVAAADLVRDALAEVAAPAFTVRVSGIGTFMMEGRLNVIWAGIEDSPVLLALHGAVGTALTAAIGFRPEERPYSPHVTLARVSAGETPGVFDGYLDRSKGIEMPSLVVSKFALYSSILRDDGPQYREEAVFNLR